MSRANRVLALTLLLWGIGEGLFLYIEPLYLRELGADPVMIGTALSLAALAMSLAHIPAGYLADHFGRKRVLAAGWLLGVVSALLMFLARDLSVFVVGLVAYTFTGFVIAPLNAYAAEARGPHSIQRAITLVYAGFWVGMVFSPSVGGWIGRAIGLRYVFAVAFGAFLLSTLLMIGFLPSQPVVPAAAGRKRYAALLRNRRLVGFLGLLLVALFAMQVGMPLLPNFVEEVRGFDVSVIGFLGSVNAAGNVLVNVFLGQRAPRRGFLLAQGFMALSMLLLLTTNSLPWLVGVYLLRAGWFLAHGMSAGQVGRLVTATESGLAYGMLEAVLGLAQMLGPLAAGALYQTAPALPFQASLGLVVLTAALFAWLAPRPEAHVEAPAPAASGEGA